MGSVQVEEGCGFATVADVLTDPFPPGLDPATVRLPTVPRVRSPEDDADHHRAYWRAHVWATLRRYQASFDDPACPPSPRADCGRVADEARRLLARATATHPISPLDSVSCHAALKELTAGAVALEQTVAALRGAPDVGTDGRPVPDPARPTDAAAVPVLPTASAPDAPHPVAPPAATSAGVHGQDFFAPATTARGFDLRLSLRGARGLRRDRELAEGRPGDDPAAAVPPADDPAAGPTV